MHPARIWLAFWGFPSLPSPQGAAHQIGGLGLRQACRLAS